MIARGPADYIDGQWHPLPEGASIRSRNPARPDEIVWSADAVEAHVGEAVEAARRAFPEWQAIGPEARMQALGRWKQAATDHVDRLAALIRLETGKIASESELPDAGQIGWTKLMPTRSATLSTTKLMKRPSELRNTLAR